jgi:hypothetical protein
MDMANNIFVKDKDKDHDKDKDMVKGKGKEENDNERRKLTSKVFSIIACLRMILYKICQQQEQQQNGNQTQRCLMEKTKTKTKTRTKTKIKTKTKTKTKTKIRQATADSICRPFPHQVGANLSMSASSRSSSIWQKVYSLLRWPSTHGNKTDAFG